MGGLTKPQTSFNQVPGVDPFIQKLSDFGGPNGFDLGGADFGQQQAKSILKQMGNGDYSGIIGTYLNPLTDAARTGERESERNMQMGANAMYQGTQPALMAGLGEEARLKGQEQLGMQYASAIPQLYGQAQQAFGQGRNRQIAEMGLDLQSLVDALNGKIGANKFSQGPSLLSQFGGAGQGLASLAGLFL